MTLSPDFLHELKKRFTGDLRLDSASRTLYSTDASIYQIEPLGVAIPKTQDDLQAAVELAAKYAIPILPRGAGSSLGGQAIGEALILDCSRHLDSILEIDPDSQTATVEPGVVLSTLNAASAKFGLTFGPDPASAERATMGGVIGNNATGAHSILYGMSADHLVSADVIMADGSLAVWNKIVLEERGKKKDDSLLSSFLSTVLDVREKYSEAIKQNFPKTWRNSAGYRLNYLLPWSPSSPPQWVGDSYPANLQPSTFNLATLLAGSEGTLAVMRRAKVNLVRKPRHTILGVLAYQSIVDACDDVPRLLEFKPSAIELIPQMIIQLARGVPSFARQMGWMTGDPAAVLVIEFSGDQPSALKEAVRRVGNVMTIAESPEEQARVWNIRKMGLGILDSRPQAARPAAFIEDCAIPVERLGEFVREIERILREHHTEGGIYAHASGGCLHIRPILNLYRGEGVRALRSIGEQVLHLALSLGGSMSSEHGDGIATGEWIEKTYGTEVTEAMRALKRAADPQNILNPKKMFDAPPMDTNLRYGENYQTKTWVPSLHFNHERGLAGAIEHCNGQGVCRKHNGVMCPSFQATRDEANSTRGRANLLRGLITNRHLPSAQEELEQATYHALDLCLACKGCTSECPSGVDMPKLKYEFMNEYYKTHRRHLRDYLFGYFHVVSKWLAPIAPLANAFMKMGWSQKLIARVTGITEKRPFPTYASRKPRLQSEIHSKKQVIFLSDVFSRYLEPEVEQAAFDLLRAAGYEVKMLPIVGSGASLLSKGFVDAARKHAEKVLSEIRALDPDSTLSVVGCEPPEVYCLKHEYSALLPNRRAELESISKRAWLVDEFLLRDENLERLQQAGENAPHNDIINFHPHCHQRAEGPSEDGLPSGTVATMELLRRFGFQVNLLDTGCCGMAGTFGYDADHYELSMQVGELKLFPKIRELGIRNGEIVSSGSACRLQIKQGAGKTAEHPLVVIARHIASNG
ncbi:FAD-linked oxidase C-terminal domain-containing protein [Candidatus Villigracilis affinis]|uniref:FAD-binding and (Fe-S)-binding domain-containing protein n=1 Tax=Candidatus Villigracilis affinis TaxID=3140682 RepID=UPI002A1A6BD9|nr:FAD-binding protein [Anaerolineales bacterium]